VEGDGGTVNWRRLNRANWDDRVPVHLASSFYDLDGFRAGADTLLSFEPFEAGTYRFPAGRPRVPMMFSVRASLDGPGER
jgi:hypothetical protein